MEEPRGLRPLAPASGLTWALFGTNQRAAEKGLVSARIPESMPQGINGWVETYPYQPSFIFSHLRHVTPTLKGAPAPGRALIQKRVFPQALRRLCSIALQ
jgi:hypothetical protein